MGDHKIDHAEEGLVAVAVRPLPVVVLGIPNRGGAGAGAHTAELVVEFAVLVGEVAGAAKELREGLCFRRRNREVFAKGAGRSPRVLRAGRSLVTG